MRHVVLAVALVVACSNTKDTRATPGSGANPNDQFCDTDPARPHAREFKDQATAEAAGCKTKRVHGSVKNEKTGEMMDNEIWVVCCP